MNTSSTKWLAPMGRSLCAAVALTSGLAAMAATSAHYFDGNVQRVITLDPSLQADITPTPAASLAGALQARSKPSGATAPLVTLRATSGPVAKATSSGLTSPVYREGDSPAGRLMALPGGVLVKFQPEWTDAQVRAWVASKGLSVSQRLEIAGNWYVLGTAPGHASLELANRLHLSGEVLSATPNWWKQTAAR